MDLRPRNLLSILSALKHNTRQKLSEHKSSCKRMESFSPFLQILLPQQEFSLVLSFCSFEDVLALQIVGENCNCTHLTDVCRSETERLGHDLIKASIWNDLDMVEELLRRKVPAAIVLSQSNGFMTPLTGAAMRGNYQVVQRLLQAGAQVNWSDENQVTALEMAMVRRRYRTELSTLHPEASLSKTIQILKQHGGRIFCDPYSE